MTVIYFVLLALIAEVLGTVGGFGSSMYFVPIAKYFLDFHTVLGITALFHVVSNLTKIQLFFKGINYSIAVKMGIPAVIFVVIGAFLSTSINSTQFELLIAILLFLVAILFLIYKNYKMPVTNLNQFIGGSGSGFAAGLVGTGGAIRGLFLSGFGLTHETYISTSALIDLGVDVSRSIVYLSHDYIGIENWYLIPILFVVSIIGTYIGKKILEKTSQEMFRKLSLVLIVLIAVSVLVKALITEYISF
ncbi:MAG: sulfite exporter TauE/SafE family protein [Saprospiraceae bacterium]|nr:sulfite exporter TauE/SafE family protein [Saprospiraceae bacterium]